MNSKKLAYPNMENYSDNSLVPRDINKWVETLKQIYFQSRNGMSKIAAEEFLTKDWDEDEKIEFRSWYNFYEEGSHLKYKKAQDWFSGNAPGYYIPLEKEETPKEKKQSPVKDVDYAKSLIMHEMPLAEKKMIIEQQRSKIVGRLDSAEKLLRSREGDLFAGPELEILIDALHNLKKKVITMNKISLSTRIYEDMFVREANILVKNGFEIAGDVLFSLSQEVQPTPPLDLPAQTEEQPSAMKEFLKNMDTSNIAVHESDEEKIEKDRDLNLVDDDILEVYDESDADFVSQAQAAPEPAVTAPTSLPGAPTGEDVVSPTPTPDANLNNFDDKLNQLFSGISVNDVVVKLEEIANVFRTREVPRQLGVIDMMLDSLGLASLFSNLPEAVNKSLEANNYCLTRIEDIISKLRGSMKSTPMELTDDKNQTSNPQAQEIKNKLESDLEKDKARKEKRKEQEDLKTDTGTPVAGKEVPQIDLPQPTPTT